MGQKLGTMGFPDPAEDTLHIMKSISYVQRNLPVERIFVPSQARVADKLRLSSLAFKTK